MHATEIMQRFNPHVLAGEDNQQQIFIEDWKDADSRWYRLEYRCQLDGRGASGWLLHNPWGTNPYSYEQSHLAGDGFICVADAASRENSPYDLDFVVRRARFWCTGYSYLREQGYAQTCRDVPEWGGG